LPTVNFNETYSFSDSPTQVFMSKLNQRVFTGQARGRQGRVVLQGQEHGLAQGQGSIGSQGCHPPTEAKP
ncbi:MAG TPA: hypothetical protein VFC55_04795, partial [Desulfobaccales bacterium]|nr:hypothetical protein [Desulfobaccales bacterium]